MRGSAAARTIRRWLTTFVFARYWDLIANSGNFVETTPLLWRHRSSPFASFTRLSDWLFAKVGRQHSIALPHLAELLFKFLTEELKLPAEKIARSLWRDYRRGERRDSPPFLRGYLNHEETMLAMRQTIMGPARQARHFTRVTPE